MEQSDGYENSFIRELVMEIQINLWSMMMYNLSALSTWANFDQGGPEKCKIYLSK